VIFKDDKYSDYPVYYASGRAGWASNNIEKVKLLLK